MCYQEMSPPRTRRRGVGVRHHLNRRPGARNGHGPVHFRRSENIATPHQETLDAYPPRRKSHPPHRLQIAPIDAVYLPPNDRPFLQPGHDRDPQMGPGQQGAVPRIPPRRVRCRPCHLVVPDGTQQDFRQGAVRRPHRPRPPDRQDSPSCPASTKIADLASISFAGSPPRPGPVAGLHQSGSWVVKLQDDGVVHHPVDRRGGGHGVGEDTFPLREHQV